MIYEKKYVVTLRKRDYGGVLNKEIELTPQEHREIFQLLQNPDTEFITFRGNFIPVSSIFSVDEQ